jgi:hypothetical protein
MAGSGEPHQAGDADTEGSGDPAVETPLCTSGGGKDSPSLVTVAGAVASGLGVLGFVTFAGGVVLWSRFKGMGLPVDHTLGLVPKSELVATGAGFLAPAVLLSLLIVVIAVLISNKMERLAPSARWSWLVSRKWLYEPRRVIAPLIVGVGGLIASCFALVATLPLVACALLVGVSTLGALVVRACGRLPFVAVSLVAFLAVGAFAIARSYELTSHDLKVLPMAYSRSQPGEAPRVEIGYFVVETSDRILFASQPEGNGSPNELREFPRSETDDLEIGDLARPAQAEERAARFAYNLCERLAHLRSATSTPTRTGSPVAVVVSVHESSSSGRLLEERASDEQGVRVSRRVRKPSPAPAPARPSPVCTSEYVQELANKAGRPWLPQATECRTHLCITGKLS